VQVLHPHADREVVRELPRIVQADERVATGNRVAGARIECQFRIERFTQTATLFSNLDGTFEFRGVPENTTTMVTAMTDTMMTAEPVRLQLSAEAQVELTVDPRHAILVRGEVVDPHGSPIKGAVVTILTPQLEQKESYGGEVTTPVPLFSSGPAIVTDADGQFVSPPINDWDRRLAVEIRAKGWRTLRTYWTDVAPLAQAEDDFEVGRLTMLPTPLDCIRSTLRSPPSQAPVASPMPSSSVLSTTVRIDLSDWHSSMRRL
jgi:hypothetical protein